MSDPWLLLLLLVPLAGLAGYLLAQRRPPRHAVVFPNLEVLAAVAVRTPQWRRHVPAVLLAAALCALVVALARPTVADSQARSGATVVLVVDVSGSMRAEDVKPTRLEAALKAMRIFVDASPRGLRIGVIAFSTDPSVITAPTADHKLVKAGIDSIELGGRTAIGDALARAVELARASQAEGGTGTTGPTRPGLPPAAVVLLSDGAQTSGLLTPEEAAARARAADVRVSTVALGTPGGVLDPSTLPRGSFGGGGGGFGGGGFGGRIPVPPDPVTLAQIASTTHGKAFTAESAGTLQSIYRGLGQSVERVETRSELTWLPLAVGMALLICFAGLAVARAPRLP